MSPWARREVRLRPAVAVERGAGPSRGPPPGGRRSLPCSRTSLPFSDWPFTPPRLGDDHFVADSERQTNIREKLDALLDRPRTPAPRPAQVGGHGRSNSAKIRLDGIAISVAASAVHARRAGRGWGFGMRGRSGRVLLAG